LREHALRNSDWLNPASTPVAVSAGERKMAKKA
jgi:hypothetical protein